jgi:hypothetical protein
MKVSMPTIDVDQLPLSEEDRDIVRRIVVKGHLRASAPPTRPITADSGLAYYVWRMVAFYVSPNPRHHCMPVTADFYTPYKWGTPEQKELIARGDRIEKVIVASIPVSQWHGVRRWGQAFGMIGTPRISEDGSVIYR